MTSQVISVRRRRMSRAARRHVAVSKPLPQLEAMEVRRLLSTVIVNTLFDESVANATTSLREAIAMAASGDTVQFQPGLSGTITLGGSELVIDKKLSISGPGTATLKVSGNNASRVLRITQGATVAMTGLTITEGRAVDGGGIYNAGALTLNNCVVSTNSVVGIDGELADPGVAGSIDRLDGGPGRGGGIYSAGTLTVTGSTLSSNAALGGNGVSRSGPDEQGALGGEGQGGAIYSIGAVTVVKSVFSDNTATGGIGSYKTGGTGAGGGIYHAGFSTWSITDSGLSGNKAVGGTSTGWSPEDTPWGVGCRGGPAQGGAIYNGHGSLVIAGGSLAGNLALGGTGATGDLLGGPGGRGSGGAISTAAAASLTDVTLTSNTAAGGEGGAYDDWVNGLQGEGGEAVGGAVEATAKLEVTRSRISSNQVNAGDGQSAWWLYEPGIAPVRSGAYGGAISGHGTTIIANSIVSNNAATGQTNYGGSATGGAIAQPTGTLTITSSTLANNKAVADATPEGRYGAAGAAASGGAIAAANLNVIGSTLAGNSAAGGGGSEYWGDRYSQEGEGGNAGAASGGAIAISAGGSAYLTGSTLSANTAIGGDGGSGYEGGGAGGVASGGAISSLGGVTLITCTISSNTVIGGAGGTGAFDSAPGGNARGGGTDGDVALIASTVAGNAAIGGAGGLGQYSEGPRGQAFGGGVSGVGGEDLPTCGNTLIAMNSADTGPDVSGLVYSSGFNLIGKSDGSSGWNSSDKTGTAALPLTPLLGPLAHNGGPTKTMMLLEGSPALDAGKSFGHTTDQRGSNRPVNLSAVPNAAGSDGSDIGAVERQALTPTQTPFKTCVIRTTAPTVIQVEDFDNGGEGIAYHDLDVKNLGSGYRTTGVDLQATTDTGGGFNVGWAKAGEWLEYTVDVQKGGRYDLAFRVASNGAGGKFHLEVDGGDVTSQLIVPNTYGWQKWKTISKSVVSLTAGKHILRLAMDANGATGSVGNFNHLTFTAAATAPVTLTSGTATYVRDGNYRWTSYGSNPVLEVKKSTTSWSRESYLNFDLCSVSSITSAKLRLYGGLTDTQTPSIQLAVYGSSNTAWSETALTWDTRPAVGSLVGSATVAGVTPQWHEIDVTSHLQAEKQVGRNTVTLVLRSNTFTNTLCSFNSDEAAANRPEVVIEQ